MATAADRLPRAGHTPARPVAVTASRFYRRRRRKSARLGQGVAGDISLGLGPGNRRRCLAQFGRQPMRTLRFTWRCTPSLLAKEVIGVVGHQVIAPPDFTSGHHLADLPLEPSAESSKSMSRRIQAKSTF